MISDAAKRPPLTDPAAYPSQLEKSCDVVMKGGVTSGIVYPLAVCELATTYRFQNIGGTSAGAIAAAATAAAEKGRSTGGFAEVAGLPLWLAQDENLFHLFRADAKTRRLFAVATAPLGPPEGRFLRLLAAVIRHYPVAVVAGAVPALILGVSLVSADGFLRVWGLVCALVLAVLGPALVVILRILRETCQALPQNFYGLCSGIGALIDGVPPLTVWLTDFLNRLANKPRDQGPLTFGDLWGDGDRATQARSPGHRAINLEMMTTCVTQGRPYRLPFRSNSFFFNPAEFRRLFPEDVVEWMCQHPGTKQASTHDHLVPFPDPADLPVVVATRMSLSFPILLSAVPLWAVDENLSSEQQQPERCWFSDGGITSNLPVQFFDAPLPRWPTFAINLRGFPPYGKESTSECENVMMAERIDLEQQEEWWDRFDTSRTGKVSLPQRLLPADRLVGFGAAIFLTMQNWADNTQLHLPGYGDRVVHIHLSADEGGTNLKMRPEVCHRLSERGRCAGEMLRERFTKGDWWDGHRWIRYRSFMAILQTMLEEWLEGYTAQALGDRSYAQLIARSKTDPPDVCRWQSGQQSFAERATESVVELARDWTTATASFSEGAPKPAPELRAVPRP